MREERFHSQITCAHNYRVRATQSTQIDLERLEKELDYLVNETKQIGNGDVLRNNKPRRQTLEQLTSLSNFSECNWQRHPKNIDRQDTKRYNFWHKLPKIKTHCNGTGVEPRHHAPAVADVKGHQGLVVCSSVGQLSDDINENAADATEKAKQNPGYCFLNQDNSAESSRKPKSAGSCRNVKCRSRCQLTKRKQPNRKAAAGHKIINLPPNAVLKITSRSALNLQRNLKKDSGIKRKLQSPSIAKKSKRPVSCSDDCAKYATYKQFGPVKQGTSPSPRAANKSNSSRYRVTPCPAAATGSSWSLPQGSVGYTFSKTSSLSSAGGMVNYRSSSDRLSATGSRSENRYKQPRRRRCRHNSAAGSPFSRHMPHGASSDLLLNQSRSARKLSKASLYRSRQRRRASSPRRRKSRGSVQHQSSGTSATPGRRKRGRPRGSGKKSRSSGSIESGHLAQGKSFGLFDRVSSLWRSYSFSRSATPVKSVSSSSRSGSWVSKMLPLPRSGHQRQLQRHRDKAYKYRRAQNDEEAVQKGVEARRQRKHTAHDIGKGSKKEKSGGSFCSIM